MSFTFSFSTLLDIKPAHVQDYLANPESLHRMSAPWTGFSWKLINNSDMQKKTDEFYYTSRLGFFYVIRIYRKIEGLSVDQTKIYDEIKLTPLFGYLSQLLFKKKIENKIKKFVAQQFRNFQEDLKRYEKFKGSLANTVVISGASGFIGSFLKLMLKLFGYHVKTLVRRKPRNDEEIFWDPYCELIEKRSLEGLYAVIHLTGENLFSFRWNKQKKQMIVDSRLKSTQFLAHTLNHLNYPPKYFLSASAVGVYGDQGDVELKENSQQGKGFLAEVAIAWEEKAKIFDKGYCIQMRFGVVISNKGGVLKKVFPLFNLGLGAVLGSGHEYLSWISLEDLAYQTLFLLKQRDIEGPFNFCSPCSLTQLQFAEQIGMVSHKSVWMHLPRWFLYLLLGEMSCLILNSIRAKPKKLLELGAKFAYPNFSETLKHNIGL